MSHRCSCGILYATHVPAFGTGYFKGTMPKIILDTDPGVDDTLALLLALTSPDIEIVGITTVAGNAPIDLTTANALRLLEAMDISTIPVARGAERPLVRQPAPALHIHGSDGLGESGLPGPDRLSPVASGAPEFITALVRDHPYADIDLVAVGPLTNVATTFLAAPDVATRLRSVVIMGGAFALTPHGHGNVTPVSEFNVWADPEAADIVFRSGASITAVGLDVTTSPGAILTSDLHETLAASTHPAARLTARVTRLGLSRRGQVQLHDPLALAAVVRPDSIETRDFPVEVVLSEGTTRGQTIADQRPRPEGEDAPTTISIATSVADPGFRDLLVGRLTGAPDR
jgi:inosine-uridine nucleoside N-ribohydrolase